MWAKAKLSRWGRPIETISLMALLAAVITIELSLGRPADVRPAGSSPALGSSAPVLWHAGNFRFLESMSADLVTFVQGLQHPKIEGYKKLSSTRKNNFNVLLDSLFAAIDASLIDGDSGDWCAVKSKASAAGYAIFRFYDADSRRWFVYGSDTSSSGQAYFFINPFAKRNIVIEVPHEGSETNTGSEGASLFKALAARALIINKEHRCSDPDESSCASADTEACPKFLRESDVAHHTANTFYLLHVRYNAMDSQTKFVQLHGFSASANDMAEIGDGTDRDVAASSVSNIFANSLRSRVPNGAAVDSCQEYSGNPPSNLCGETNVEGRYSNHPDSSECPVAVSASTARFLHIEQALTLRDDDNSDGWYWGDVRDALLAVWPDCNMNNGATDCLLGSPQTEYAGLTCPPAATASGKD